MLECDEGTQSVDSLTFSAQVCLDLVSKNSKAPPPTWARALSV